MVDGVLIVDKPGGLTSHDVVARVKRWVRPSRVGHTGTLDPMATGVLVLCIGAATRLARFLAGGSKEYTGEIVLGARTDTYDAEGTVLETREIAGIDLESVRAHASAFIGEVLQVPPPWSAKKIAGRRAYDLARSGKAIHPAPCLVHVEEFDVRTLEGARATFRTVCSAGTYVRSLVDDLGESLGCGAHLTSLRRTRNGPFEISRATPLCAIEEAGRAGVLRSRAIPLDSLELGLPEARVTEAGERLAAAGRVVPLGEIAGPAPPAASRTVRIVAPDGRLIGLAELAPAGLQPRVVLPRSGDT